MGILCSQLRNSYIPSDRTGNFDPSSTVSDPCISTTPFLTQFRRLPAVFSMHKFIHQIEEKRQAIFVGFFGPIGVSAIFYLYLSLQFLETITVEGVIREDAEQLSEVFIIVVWFLAVCSIVGPISCDPRP